MRHYTEEILRNAEKLNPLKARKGESTKRHDKNDHKRKEWGKACADFHARYDSLALSGGLDKILRNTWLSFFTLLDKFSEQPLCIQFSITSMFFVLLYIYNLVVNE